MTRHDMVSVQADIADLNAWVFRALRHPGHAAWARSHWGVQDKALELFQCASKAHIACIATCGVPVPELRIPETTSDAGEPVPDELAQLHALALLAALRASLINETAAALLFRAPPDALARLQDWPMLQIWNAAANHADVLRLDCGRPPAFWRTLLSGAGVGGGTGANLSRTLLLMGTA